MNIIFLFNGFFSIIFVIFLIDLWFDCEKFYGICGRGGI